MTVAGDLKSMNNNTADMEYSANTTVTDDASAPAIVSNNKSNSTKQHLAIECGDGRIERDRFKSKNKKMKVQLACLTAALVICCIVITGVEVSVRFEFFFFPISIYNIFKCLFCISNLKIIFFFV